LVAFLFTDETAEEFVMYWATSPQVCCRITLWNFDV